MFEYSSLSHLLSVFCGLFAVATGTVMLLSPRFYGSFIDELERGAGLKALSGIVAFAIGSLFLVLHDGWASMAAIAIWAIGWISLAEGILLLAVPSLYTALLRRMPRTTASVQALGGFAGVLGIALLYIGLARL